MFKHTIAETSAKASIFASLTIGALIATGGLTTPEFQLLAGVQLLSTVLLACLKLTQATRIDRNHFDLYDLACVIVIGFLTLMNVLAGSIFESRLMLPCLGLAAVGLGLYGFSWLSELKHRERFGAERLR